ncbi:hypothetical protein IAR50_000846 [Cryptococcus sp. DSM 104548]
MPHCPRTLPIPIESLQRLPPELIAPIHDLVFDTRSICCPAQFVNVLRTTRAYYNMDASLLYHVVTLEDHNCAAVFGGREELPEDQGSRFDVDSWDSVTRRSQTFQHHEEATYQTHVPASVFLSKPAKPFYGATAAHCGSRRRKRSKWLVPPLSGSRPSTRWSLSYLDEGDPPPRLDAAIQDPLSFPSLTSIFFAPPIMQALRDRPDHGQTVLRPGAHWTMASVEISAKAAMSILMNWLTTRAVVCIQMSSYTEMTA